MIGQRRLAPGPAASSSHELTHDTVRQQYVVQHRHKQSKTRLRAADRPWFEGGWQSIIFDPADTSAARAAEIEAHQCMDRVYGTAMECRMVLVTKRDTVSVEVVPTTWEASR